MRLIIFLCLLCTHLAFSQDSTQTLIEGERALAQFQTTLQEGSPSEQATALWNTGKYYYAKGAYKQAADALQQLVLEPASKEYLSKVKYQLAMSCYLASVQDSSYRACADSALQSLLLQLEPEDYAFTQAMLLKSWFLVQESKFDLAETALKRASIYAGPDHASAQQLLCLDIHEKGLKSPNARQDCLQRFPILAHNSVALNQSATSPAPATPTIPSQPTNATTASASTATMEPAAPINNSSLAQNSAVNTPVPANSSAEQGAWTLQLGAFSQKENAEMLVESLNTTGFTAQIIPLETAMSSLWLVRLGNFSTREGALEFGSQKLSPLGLDFQARKK